MMNESATPGARGKCLHDPSAPSSRMLKLLVRALASYDQIVLELRLYALLPELAPLQRSGRVPSRLATTWKILHT
jgi:hypothetical protein